MRRPRRSSPRARAAMALVALVCAGGAVYGFAAGPAGAQKGTSVNPMPAPPVTNPAQVDRGRQLFLDGCSSCHGNDARGKRNLAPTLVGAGAAAADFYVSTGRMPLSNPTDQPTRAKPAYNRQDIAALAAYVGSLGAGPVVPKVDAAKGNIANGLSSFTLHCAGCHQVGGAGGIVTGGIAPPLNSSDITPAQIAEAIRVGPYLMPNFNAQQISDQDINDIVRYVRSTTHPDDAGGWGIGHIGPIPEGMIAWFLAIVSLLVVARLIGEREPE
ncbi:MAG TPA: c-type cytochrome [Solirubrobacteraceae bacterium]|nr:c-type cytochrome [Solirubrobacteraceae bacterium]